MNSTRLLPAFIPTIPQRVNHSLAPPSHHGLFDILDAEETDGRLTATVQFDLDFLLDFYQSVPSAQTRSDFMAVVEEAFMETLDQFDFGSDAPAGSEIMVIDPKTAEPVACGIVIENSEGGITLENGFYDRDSYAFRYMEGMD
jgi:hypothetical protein